MVLGINFQETLKSGLLSDFHFEVFSTPGQIVHSVPRKANFGKNLLSLEITNAPKSYDPSLESIFDNKFDQVKKFEIF